MWLLLSYRLPVGNSEPVLLSGQLQSTVLDMVEDPLTQLNTVDDPLIQVHTVTVEDPLIQLYPVEDLLIQLFTVEDPLMQLLPFWGNMSKKKKKLRELISWFMLMAFYNSKPRFWELSQLIILVHIYPQFPLQICTICTVRFFHCYSRVQPLAQGDWIVVGGLHTKKLILLPLSLPLPCLILLCPSLAVSQSCSIPCPLFCFLVQGMYYVYYSTGGICMELGSPEKWHQIVAPIATMTMLQEREIPYKQITTVANSRDGINAEQVWASQL